ncbi:sensor histidine kinase [Truepera radiovictrix]|uniref:sensor histidine kinase n=1 Tax=Truepera radiovictrix TaxID=332249 RepID=UPI0011D0BF9C|nr:HAMP domain-containing sensor histidine kinase [Truepera radiovictrix]WMT56742.1 HAMP domain-containing sensor histidine kinase [Truepera radiovictrix]
MRGLRGVSLQLRLTLVFTAFLALVLIVVAVVVYGLTQRSILETVASRAEQEYSNALEAMRQNPALDSSTRGGWVQNLSGDTQLFVNIYLPEPQLSARSTPFFAFERVPQMYVVKDAGGEALSEYLGDADLQRLLSGEPLSQVVRDVRGRTWYVEGRLERFNLSNLEVPAAMMVALPVSTDTLSQLRINLIQTIVVAFVGFALGVWFLAQRVLAPLKQVTQAASRISSHDLSQRVPAPPTRDEVGELALTLNRMLGRLQETFETQRRFTADASHELRTPVTAIAGHASYLLRRTNPTPEQEESLKIIRSEAARMSKLVNDLLELARADAGFSVDRVPFNLVEVVEEVKKELAPVLGGASLRTFSPQPLLEIEGDAGRLKQVLLNLVQNALNAGATQVDVSLTLEGRRARLEVLDNGPGIPEGALPKLFDRFYRVDGARSTRGNGSGLGLAIVKWIVEQHGGEVTVESKVGEGTVFTVFLPAPPQAGALPVPRPRVAKAAQV